MMYTEDVRKRLDGILKALESYIDGFDIAYSKKIDYIMIRDVLFNEIINDVNVSPEYFSFYAKIKFKEGMTLTRS